MASAKTPRKSRTKKGAAPVADPTVAADPVADTSSANEVVAADAPVADAPVAGDAHGPVDPADAAAVTADEEVGTVRPDVQTQRVGDALAAAVAARAASPAAHLRQAHYAREFLARLHADLHPAGVGIESIPGWADVAQQVETTILDAPRADAAQTGAALRAALLDAQSGVPNRAWESVISRAAAAGADADDERGEELHDWLEARITAALDGAAKELQSHDCAGYLSAVDARQAARDSEGWGTSVYTGRGSAQSVQCLVTHPRLRVPTSTSRPIDPTDPLAQHLLAVGPGVIPCYTDSEGRWVPELHADELAYLAAHPDGGRVQLHLLVYADPATDDAVLATRLAAALSAPDAVERRHLLALRVAALLADGDLDGEVKRARGIRLALAAGVQVPTDRSKVDDFLRKQADFGSVCPGKKDGSDAGAKLALDALFRAGVLRGDDIRRDLSPRKVAPAAREAAYTRLLEVALDARESGQPRLGGIVSSAGTVSLRASRALLAVLNGNDLGLARWTGELGAGKPPEGWGLSAKTAPVAAALVESEAAEGLWDVWENSAAKAGAKKGADAAADAAPVEDAAPEPAPEPAQPDLAALREAFAAALRAAGIASDSLAGRVALAGFAVGAGQLSVDEGVAEVAVVTADAPVTTAPAAAPVEVVEQVLVDVVGTPMSLPA